MVALQDTAEPSPFEAYPDVTQSIAHMQLRVRPKPEPKTLISLISEARRPTRRARCVLKL